MAGARPSRLLAEMLAVRWHRAPRTAGHRGGRAGARARPLGRPAECRGGAAERCRHRGACAHSDELHRQLVPADHACLPVSTSLRNRTRRAALDRSALIPLDRPRPRTLRRRAGA